MVWPTCEVVALCCTTVCPRIFTDWPKFKPWITEWWYHWNETFLTPSWWSQNVLATANRNFLTQFLGRIENAKIDCLVYFIPELVKSGDFAWWTCKNLGHFWSICVITQQLWKSHDFTNVLQDYHCNRH